jgi:two-component system chemotaxis response regulator CheY
MNQKINILLVDDVEYSRDLLRSSLIAAIDDEKLALEPHFFHASKGEIMLDIVKSKQIHMVYLDINLGSENGLDLLQSIKKQSADITVVMVSGEGSVQNVMKAIENGANGFIVKPFNTGRITETLRKHLQVEKS